jgi:HEAT repeat protein
MRTLAVVALLCAAAFAQDAATLLERLGGDGREDAARQLISMGPKAFPDVVQGLDHDDVAVRRAAAEILAYYSRSMKTVEPHGKALALALKNDDDPIVRRHAGEALLKAGPESLKWLERAFACRYADARVAAGRAIGHIGPKGNPTLLKNLKSVSSRRREAALAGVRESGAPVFLPALLPMLKDKDADVRARAAAALGAFRESDKTVPALLGALRDKPVVARAAALALAPFAKDRLPEILAEVPATGDALDAMLEHLPADALPAWEHALSTASPSLRARLLRTLPRAHFEHLSDGTRDTVRGWAKADDAATRRVVAGLLVGGHLGGAADLLRALAADPDELVRNEAMPGFARKPDVLRAALKDPSVRVRATAALLLWRHDRSTDALPHLVAALEAGLPAAADGIGELGPRGASATAKLAKATASDDPGLAVAAVRALGRVLASGGSPFVGRAERFARLPQPVRAACGKACAWLAANQAADGRWDSDAFGGGEHYDVGLTGLSLLAFSGAGVPKAYEGHYERGISFLRMQQRAGMIGSGVHHTVHLQHAIATTALAEATVRTDAHDGAVRRALNVIAGWRNPYMAWRYEPRGGENDTFVTAWMATALRTGELAGFEVNHEAYKGALQWVDKMTDPNFGQVGYNYPGGSVARPNPDGPGTHTGPRYPAGLVIVRWNESAAERRKRARLEAEYSEKLRKAGMTYAENSQACTAAGIWVRGVITRAWRFSETMRKGFQLIRELPPRWVPRQGHVDLCYWHWGALAIEQVDGSDPWRLRLEETLLSKQREDGSWDPIGVWGKEGGRVFSTATCALALLAPVSHPHEVLDDRNWRERHEEGFDALRKALASNDERIRAAAKEFADLVR